MASENREYFTGEGAIWWTAEQAAREFKISAREIEDRYRPYLDPDHIIPLVRKTPRSSGEPRKYLREALLDLRHKKVMSRRVKEIPPRAKNGQFTKSS